MTSIEPFTPTFSSDQWEDLRARIKRTRWPDEIRESDWGDELQFLKDLCRYWSEDFDWQKQIDRLSRFPHYRFQSDQGIQRGGYTFPCQKPLHPFGAWQIAPRIGLYSKLSHSFLWSRAWRIAAYLCYG
jgi:hypothetical protein